MSSYERAAAIGAALFLVALLGVAGLSTAYFKKAPQLLERLTDPIRSQLPGYRCPTAIEPLAGRVMCDVRTGRLVASADCTDTTRLNEQLLPFGDVPATLNEGRCSIQLPASNQLAGLRLVSGDRGDGVLMADFEISSGQLIVALAVRCQETSCLTLAVNNTGDFEVRERHGTDKWTQLATGSGSAPSGRLATTHTNRLVFQYRKGRWIAYLNNRRIANGAFHLSAGETGTANFFADNADSKPISVSLDRLYLFAAG